MHLLCYLFALFLQHTLAELSANQVLEAYPLIDGHNDLAFQITRYYRNDISSFHFENDYTEDSYHKLHTDLPRLKKGKVGAQFWVAYVSCTAQYKDAVAVYLEQVDLIRRLIGKYAEDMELVTSADGILETFKKGKIASLIGVEGGHAIDSRISMLRIYYELGVRYMTLTHTCSTPWVDSAAVDDNPNLPQRGLTDFGKAVVFEMNRLGMLVDLSHTSKRVMDDTIRLSKAPVAFTHSNAFSIYNHSRNVHDDTLRLLKDHEGIIMVNFYSGFLGAGDVDIEKVVEHINYIVDQIGHDYVGIGSDYDGIDRTPKDLEDVSKYPNLFEELIKNNKTRWTLENLEKLAGRNFIRVFRKVEETKDSMKAAAPTEILVNERDIYAEGWNCRSTYDNLVTDPLKLLDAFNKSNNFTVPLINSND